MPAEKPTPDSSKRPRIKTEEPMQPEMSLASAGAIPAGPGPRTEQAAGLSVWEFAQVLRKQYYVYEVLFTAGAGDMAILITGGFSDTTNIPVWKRDTIIAMIVRSDRVDDALPGWRDRIAHIHASREPGHLPIAELSVGTPRIFHHLIAAAHHSSWTPGLEEEVSDFYEIQDRLSLEELHDMAILSHQYQAFNLIAGNVPTWIIDSPSMPLGWKPEYHADGYSKQLEYLWISYEFGLDSMFHRVCFNLAYVRADLSRNPRTMPPGIFDRIEECRKAYMTALVTDIRNYLEDLQEAVKPGNTVPYPICKNEPESRQCAEMQLLELQSWIEQDSINTDPDQSYSLSDGRSPFSFFK